MFQPGSTSVPAPSTKFSCFLLPRWMELYNLKQLLTLFISDLDLCIQDLLRSFSETTTEDKIKKPIFKAGTKKRKLSTNDAFAKIDKALEAFVSYQQAADRSFLEAEEARERREEEREKKRRKEDQEFLLKLAQVLRK